MTTATEKKFIRYFWIIFLTPILLLSFWILGVALFGQLPSFEELENPKSNLASEVYSADQVMLGKWYYENRSNVRYGDLSPNVINALKATEDIRFEKHSGVDIRGLFRVMIRTIILRQSTAGGGSTITQQLAKNLFPRKRFRSMFDKVTTKIKEWITAIRLEKNYTKEEILAMYLNTVEFGSNSFGIKSAARTFFNKEPRHLNINESATLVGLLKAPSYYSPVRNPKNSRIRRNVVLMQMHKYGFINKGQLDSLQKQPISLKFQAEDHISGLATYFREYLRLELSKWCEDHKKADGTPYNLYTDGLRIYTTINSTMQRYAEEAVAEHIKELQKQFFKHWKGRGVPWGSHKEVITEAVRRSERYSQLKRNGVPEAQIQNIFNIQVPMKIFTWEGDKDTVMSPMDSIKYYKYFLQTGFMSMEPQTGYIRAWVGGINYKYFKYDHVKEGRRQVGSTFKPFLYTLAMQEGFSPCTKIPNSPVTFYDEWGKPYTPENAEPDDDGKMMTLKEALAKSVNRISAYLIKQFGPKAVIEMARKMGITSPLSPYPSICLGVDDLSVYEMVGAYGTFANKGVWTEPIYITRIEDKNGNILEERLPRKVEAINEETAFLMTELLKGVTLGGGTAVSLRYKYKLNQSIAGKTGTTQNHSDGWFMGVTPELVSGCWVGCEDRSVHFRSLELGQGARMALPIWGLYMQKVYADKDLKIYQGDFEKPSTPVNVETDCSKYNQNSNSFGTEF
jgi:penicillin-binding protein 1A